MQDGIEKQEWLTEMATNLMYYDEFLEYIEAMEIAEKLWETLNQDD